MKKSGQGGSLRDLSLSAGELHVREVKMINRGDKGYREGKCLYRFPHRELKTVIAKPQMAGCIRHPVLSWDFIPEMENKWQELKCQDVLRDALNLLLNPTCLNTLLLHHPQGWLPHRWCRQDTWCLPVPTTPRFIMLYTQPWVVNQRPESRRFCDSSSSLAGVLTYGV